MAFPPKRHEVAGAAKARRVFSWEAIHRALERFVCSAKMGDCLQYFPTVKSRKKLLSRKKRVVYVKLRLVAVWLIFECGIDVSAV